MPCMTGRTRRQRTPIPKVHRCDASRSAPCGLRQLASAPLHAVRRAAFLAQANTIMGRGVAKRFLIDPYRYTECVKGREDEEESALQADCPKL